MQTLTSKQLEALSRLSLDRDYQEVVAWVKASIDEEVSRMLGTHGPERDDFAGGIIQLKQIVKASESARQIADAMATPNLSAGGIP